VDPETTRKERSCASEKPPQSGSEKYCEGATRKGAYSQEPGSAYAGDASPREDHGHIHRARAECTPDEKEQQRELKSEMPSINVSDGGKQGKEDGGSEEIRGANIAGMSE
jgi:hypothetical protein